MHLVALVVALLAVVAILAIGIRFLLAPSVAMSGYGIAPGSERALTEIKGVRDITSGVVLLVMWAAVGRQALGWALIAMTITPVADAVIVLRNGGKLATALTVHGLTAVLVLAAGLILATA